MSRLAWILFCFRDLGFDIFFATTFRIFHPNISFSVHSKSSVENGEENSRKSSQKIMLNFILFPSSNRGLENKIKFMQFDSSRYEEGKSKFLQIWSCEGSLEKWRHILGNMENMCCRRPMKKSICVVALKMVYYLMFSCTNIHLEMLHRKRFLFCWM